MSLLSFCFYSVAIHEGQGLLCRTEVCAYGLGRTAAGGKICALATHSMSAPLLGAGGDICSSCNRLCGIEDRSINEAGVQTSPLACHRKNVLQWSLLPPSLPFYLLRSLCCHAATAHFYVQRDGGLSSTPRQPPFQPDLNRHYKTFTARKWSHKHTVFERDHLQAAFIFSCLL